MAELSRVYQGKEFKVISATKDFYSSEAYLENAQRWVNDNGYTTWTLEEIDLDLFTSGHLAIGKDFQRSIAWLMVPNEPARFCNDWLEQA